MTSQSNLISLGAADVKVNPLGIGTWQWGDRIFWGYSRSYSDVDLRAAFDATLAAGISFFDTAELYGGGRSEQLLGEFIRSSGQSASVATKFMPYPWRLRRASLVAALRRSLDRLGLPRVDLYQIHWPFPPVPIETWADALADAVEAGLARAVGVSNFSAGQMRRAHAVLARRGVPLASNQVQYSLLDRRPEHSGLLAACRDLKVTLIAYSPLAKGFLTGKYTTHSPPMGLRRALWSRAGPGRIQSLVDLLSQIGERHDGKTPAQVALNWIIARGAVPIPGVKNVKQAQENAGALGWPLTPDEVAALDTASDRRH